ncbi:MAG: hypothetical protein H0U97_11030 [Gammaproteobacteria bacterium]|nr:hypothetical protein [Gammaproteobacteria bacterium]
MQSINPAIRAKPKKFRVFIVLPPACCLTLCKVFLSVSAISSQGMAARAAEIVPERIAPGSSAAIAVASLLFAVLMAVSEKHFRENLNCSSGGGIFLRKVMASVSAPRGGGAS